LFTFRERIKFTGFLFSVSLPPTPNRNSVWFTFLHIHAIQGARRSHLGSRHSEQIHVATFHTMFTFGFLGSGQTLMGNSKFFSRRLDHSHFHSKPWFVFNFNLSVLSLHLRSNNELMLENKSKFNICRRNAKFLLKKKFSMRISSLKFDPLNDQQQLYIRWYAVESEFKPIFCASS
jgi:hypothetical protein